jgi:hypothetical protein
MSLTLDGTNGITSSGGVNVLQADAVITSNLVDGAVTVPKIGATGTPGSGNFLRGDGSWEAISTTPTTAQVLDATAGATAGAVGTYAMLGVVSGDDPFEEGTTKAGSELRFGNTSAGISRPISDREPSGTWQLMGTIGYTNGSPSTGIAARGSVWLRIS